MFHLSFFARGYCCTDPRAQKCIIGKGTSAKNRCNQKLFRLLDGWVEFPSLFSFSEHDSYFVFRGLFHCYSRAMNIYVHHGCVYKWAHHSRLTIGLIGAVRLQLFPKAPLWQTWEFVPNSRGCSRVCSVS